MCQTLLTTTDAQVNNLKINMLSATHHEGKPPMKRTVFVHTEPGLSHHSYFRYLVTEGACVSSHSSTVAPINKVKPSFIVQTLFRRGKHLAKRADCFEYGIVEEEDDELTWGGRYLSTTKSFHVYILCQKRTENAV